ncbi:MAG: molybdopterin molybdotransferase MoeA [Methanobacteriaceae archaeon]|jgi:molybdopterin molybdotransferase|nr:molybdopterin molybdotransferase MoeA [Methanobacteriaceae archaeon]MDO9628172.1 molybdopterin molybdotransferase MoeA [Methanobacteriaceae archaeon]
MFLSKLIPVEKARQIIEENQKIMSEEIIKLEKAHNRVNCSEFISQHNSPPFDRSAMDGYALQAQDTFTSSPSNPAHLTIIDRIGAGDSSSVEIISGQAVKIATGAPIPAGADAVVMEEYTYEKGDQLEVLATLSPGENVSYVGEDISKGDKILGSGRLLRPQELALIASAGYGDVEVYKKPKVGVIVTGNELVDPTFHLKGAEVINSNQYALRALVESAMAECEISHCRDDAQLMEKAISEAAEKYDVIITTGGTAISKGDVVVDTVDKLGEVLIHGVAVRPGKPVGFGIVNEKSIFMLSGYPVAAMVLFDVFVRTYLLKMQNINYEHQPVKKVAQKKIPSNLGRTDYIRAFVDVNGVRPVMSKGSGVIRAMVDSNAYVFIEENQEGVGEGEECDVILFDSFKV